MNEIGIILTLNKQNYTIMREGTKKPLFLAIKKVFVNKIPRH